MPIRAPVVARAVHLGEVVFGADFRLALEELHAEARGYVEGNVAVHEPGAWVVGFESQDEVASSGEISRVATDGVVRSESRNVAIPDRVFYLGEDVEVVAVEMDGVGKWWRCVVGRVLLNYPVLPLIRPLVREMRYHAP